MPNNQSSLTQMSLTKYALPPHVTVRKNATGKLRFYFAPKRNLPQGWYSADNKQIIPRVPIDSGIWELNYNDPIFKVALFKDAAELLDRLERDRQGIITPKYKPNTLQAIADDWETETSGHWQALKPRTQRQYQSDFKNIFAFSQALGNPHVKDITPMHIRAFQSKSNLPPSTIEHAITTMSVIFSRAVERGILPQNPIKQMGKFKTTKKPQRKPIDVWTQEDVAQYVDAAKALQWLGGAILIQGLWETMGRVSDASLWRCDNLSGNLLSYMTSKSDGERLAMAIMSADFINIARQAESIYLVTQKDGIRIYREAIDDRQLGRDFAAVRKLVVKNGGRYLLLGKLRHSSQTHADGLGITINQMQIATTHADKEMAQRKYIQANLPTAMEIAKRRGII